MNFKEYIWSGNPLHSKEPTHSRLKQNDLVQAAPSFFQYVNPTEPHYRWLSKGTTIVPMLRLDDDGNGPRIKALVNSATDKLLTNNECVAIIEVGSPFFINSFIDLQFSPVLKDALDPSQKMNYKIQQGSQVFAGDYRYFDELKRKVMELYKNYKEMQRHEF